MSALRSSFTRSPHGLRPHGRDRHFPNIQGFRGYGSDSGHTPFTSLLLFVLPLAFAFSRYTTERLTRPYSGGPTRLRGFPLDRQPLPGYLRVGRSLPELQGDVCVLCLPPAFAAVPQYLVHTPVELLPLIEPDKRISHTYGSSVSHSASLRSTTRVQVYADSRRGPSNMGKCLDETGPRVCPPLALAVEPVEQDLFAAMDIVPTSVCVIRDGVIAQVADHAGACQPQHVTFSHYAPGFAGPVREPAQALAQLLTAGAAFHLVISLSRLPAVVRES